MKKKKHKNALDARPPHGLAFHPQRGVRDMAHLKAGWRWLEPYEVEMFRQGITPRVTPLVKSGVWRGKVGLVERAKARALMRNRGE